MKVTKFSCGPAANESERTAIEYLEKRLKSEPGDGEWVLLTNLTFSVTHQLQSDEIDIVAIGPPGVRVAEIKHWTASWVTTYKDLVEHEADRVTSKARKIGTTLRKIFPDLPYVDGVFLLTRETSKVRPLANQQIRGVSFHTLHDWKRALNVAGQAVLSAQQVRNFARLLAPKIAVAIDGSIRRLAGYVNLELRSPRDERFHRIYKGIHSARQDRVVLHLYDLSASEEKNAEAKAQRAYEAMHRLQLYPWVPRILDSYQEVPGYAGEMYFFTVIDPAAPTLKDRLADPSWTLAARLAFARSTIRAILELHGASTQDEPMVHRNLSPHTILVKHDNTPLISGFECTRIPSEVSVASSSLPASIDRETAAPEVVAHGLNAADHRSDVYSLCASLRILFLNQASDDARRAAEVLSQGMAEDPNARCPLADLELELKKLLGESTPPPAVPPSRFWTEDQIVRFGERDYRILTRLGSGGVGTTFKVVEIDQNMQDLGTYVGKVVHDREVGGRVLKTYRLARSHLRHSGLSTIFEVAREWRENNFVALMTWIEGSPLAEFIGVFLLLAEDQQEASAEALAVRWLRAMCHALDVLHHNGMCHGDVSPRNVIVSGSDVVLTDYDFVTPFGEIPGAAGTVQYCSPERQQRQPASPADDLFALAASFFHVVFDKEPFWHGGELAKERGLNWDGIDRDKYPILVAVLDRATHPDKTRRFQTVNEMLAALRPTAEPSPNVHVQDREADGVSVGSGDATATPSTRGATRSSGESDVGPVSGQRGNLSRQQVAWLKGLLQSYPGSRWGNQETRGLDTEFAAKTYVPTPLEESLLRDIRERRVRLVILCGNAGDGKTALLQHLALKLELGRHRSTERLLKGKLPGGPTVRMNLDGSAAWQGKSADELLDQFLAPFQQGTPTQDIVHLLAINDGRLLEWTKNYAQRHGKTPLTEAIYSLLQGDAVDQSSHIRFISLNQRSLVGGVTSGGTAIDAGFLERLLDHLFGDAKAQEIWAPCRSCSAQERCRVYQAVQVFGPDTIPSSVPVAGHQPSAPLDLPQPDVRAEVRPRARKRLFEALQAVHLRGETHITMRELRAALVYILFGVHFCDDYHRGEFLDEGEPLPYWDRAFAADSPARQGEVLRELARFDPALDSHPQVDRYLLSDSWRDSSRSAPRYPKLSLESARRRAFFEWTETDLEQVVGETGNPADALDLPRGRHIREFRRIPLIRDPAELSSITRRLCEGISRLEDLPPQAYKRAGVVPLRTEPKTPTETAFWVEKPLANFRIEPVLPPETGGIERLHRQVALIYRYRDGSEERLLLGAELFHLLLELADGYQLGDVSTDDTFANLSIFVQRLVREDERELLAWNPMDDERIYRVAAVTQTTAQGTLQTLVIHPVGEETEP